MSAATRLMIIKIYADLVRPAGFEPATPWFEAKYSNPLSYGRSLAFTIGLRKLNKFA